MKYHLNISIIVAMARPPSENCCYSYSCFVSWAVVMGFVSLGLAITGLSFMYGTNSQTQYVSSGVVLLVIAAVGAYPTLMLGFKAMIIKNLYGEEHTIQDIGTQRKVDRMAWILMSEHIEALTMCWTFFLLGLAFIPQLATDFVISGAVILAAAFVFAAMWITFKLMRDKVLIEKKIKELNTNNNLNWTATDSQKK